MKMIFALTAALVVCSSLSMFAQGTVVLGNSGGSKISTNSFGGGPATGLTSPNIAAGGGMNFYYALFYSTTQTSVAGNTGALLGGGGTYAFSAAGWVDGSTATGYATNTTAGRLQPSNPNSDGSASVANLPGGSTAQFVVIGWSANIGSTISALEAWYANPSVLGYIGESAVSGPLSPGTLGSTSPVTIWGAAPNIPGFTLGLDVPEPGTLALAALGGASLLLFRRKK